MEVKPLFSLLVAKAAIVNQLSSLSVCFTRFDRVIPKGTGNSLLFLPIFEQRKGENEAFIPII
jgi:hypothetical protein